jgi:hypothetical protein
MQPQVNIVVVVDVIRALSDGTLRDGNVCMVDDGVDGSTGQGTPDLCTVCRPGQLIRWAVIPVDVQTPAEIRNITFLDPGTGDGTPDRGDPDRPAGNPALDVWAGVVPPFLAPGVPYRYRLELQLYQGEASVLHIDTPALRVPATASRAGAVP